MILCVSLREFSNWTECSEIILDGLLSCVHFKLTKVFLIYWLNLVMHSVVGINSKTVSFVSLPKSKYSSIALRIKQYILLYWDGHISTFFLSSGLFYMV